MADKFGNFKEFYAFYLNEHSHPTTRALHFSGSCLALFFVVLFIVSPSYLYLLLALLSGYGFAWFAHFKFEKNRPATFNYPFYSFLADWVMFKDILCGKVKLK